MAFSRRLETETVRKMIMLYCHDKHNTSENILCPDCTSLFEYAQKRIDRCPYQDKKPVCSKCTVHCYKPKMKDEIKVVMRYSGPRMLWKSPVLSVRYFYRKIFKSRLR
ncbi:MAG: nitrous oxide-stimulated promoter family protein [Chitinophagales bacterium]